MAVPTYLLKDIQLQVQILGAKAFTATALTDGQNELGMTTAELIAMILSRTDLSCYKTMPSTAIQGAFHDVYHWPTPSLQIAYIKFCLHPNSKVVVSFKEK